MKKIVLTLVAMMSMTMAFAADENSNKENAAVAAQIAKYDIDINVNSLGRTLGLDFDTKRTVSYIADDFKRDMKKAGAEANEDARDAMYKKAINHNLSYMRAVLDGEQYHEYVKLLNTTINNRGLNK